MTKRKEPGAGSEDPIDDFRPVMLRSRQDGWSPQKQTDFIQALAECGCVEEACKRVGMSVSSAYALRARVDAQSFRFAWLAAIDQSVERLSDAAFARAIHGVTQPIFYQGEQIGERTYYDTRLTMFLLRYRDPNRYGKWNDLFTWEPEADDAALTLGACLLRLIKDGNAFEAGDPPPEHKPHDPVRRTTLHRLYDKMFRRQRDHGQGGN